MSDMILCPECGMENSQQPFCENCGYRLRSQRTVLEGLPSITADVLANTSVQRPEIVSTQESVVISQERGANISDSEVGLDEGVVPAAPVALESASKTLMEGTPAIRRRETLEETPAVTPDMLTATDPAPSQHPPSATSSSSLIAAPSSLADEAERGPRRMVVGMLWVVTVVVAILGTFFAVSSTNLGDRKEDVGHPPAELMRIVVPEGTFLQGLDVPTRSFILKLCFRVSSNPDEECEQDKLLKDEYPQASVNLPAFAIDSQEVTNERYAACVAAGACEAVDYKSCKVYTTQGLQIGLRVPKILREPTHPQLCVRRSDAEAFCAYMKGTLPSQAQWEKAARGEEGLLFPWGETWDPQFANWGEADIIKTPIVGKVDGFSWTAPPGQYPKARSPYDIDDLAGNVAEWVMSDDDVMGVTRGGSWTSDPFELRTTRRHEVKLNDRRTDVGFRCVYPEP